MLDQTVDPVFDHSWIPSSAWQCLQFPKLSKLAQENADFLDDVPVMSATVLGLEMLLNESCIDLRKASELVLSDVGATIQTLRLVGRDYDFAADLPCRMGDCIASLDLGTWFCAMSARTFGFTANMRRRLRSGSTVVWLPNTPNLSPSPSIAFLRKMRTWLGCCMR